MPGITGLYVGSVLLEAGRRLHDHLTGWRAQVLRVPVYCRAIKKLWPGFSQSKQQRWRSLAQFFV
jgi:hypothetical protein